MSKKVVISKSGYDATSETDPDNLIFSSDYNTLKYYKSGNESITINGDGSDQSTTESVYHGLGYVPFFIAYVNDFVNNTTKYYIAPFYSSTISVTREAFVWADENYIYFKMRNKSSSNYTANFYYKIFRNSLGVASSTSPSASQSPSASASPSA